MSRASRRAAMEVRAKKFECKVNWICFLPLFSLATLMVLARPIHRPKFYIHEFYVPALHVSPDNPNSNITRTSHTIFFDLKLQNSMDYRGVRYYPLNLTFFYVSNTTNSPLLVANYTVPGFYQGYGKAAMRRNVVVAQGLPWEEALRAVSGGSTAVFQVNLTANMKFKFVASNTGRKMVKVGANVEVDSYGRKVKKDDVKLISLV